MKNCRLVLEYNVIKKIRLSVSLSFHKHSQCFVDILYIENTVETRIKEPTFIRTLRLKFNILNPLNKNMSEAETGGGSYITGFISSEFTRTLKNS